uniref:Protein kinase domain-containing protein n=1 Tax=Setaria italica TaxID=4555 RepID=K3ZZU2_SETIT
MLLQLCAALVLLLVPAHRGAAATGGGSDGHQFVYNGFAGASMSLDGSAEVTPNGLLMLTNGTIQMKGHAFHTDPLPFGGAAQKPRSFSTTFVFAIYGPYVDLSSHGLAFFVSPDKELLSTALPGQFLGLLNTTYNGNRSAHIFAVEFDTLLNADFHDINSNHVGIDVNSLRSIAAADAGYYDDGTGRFRNLSLVSRKAIQVWVDYDGEATQVTVTMAPLGVPRPKKPLLQTAVDLSGVMRGTAYVGFTSATGVLFSRHFVAGWSFALDGPAPPLNVAALPGLPPAGSKPRSKVLEIVLPIASVTLLLAVGVSIFTLVRRRIKYTEVREDWETALGTHRFSYKELFHATKGFSEKRLLGKGGFGSVYKGALHKSGMEVAVKKVSHEPKHGMKELVTEVSSIGRLRHRNLVQLLGYCRRKEVTCGRRPVGEDEHKNCVVLVDWVAEHWRRGLIIDAADTMIPSGFDPDEITLVLKLGLMCSHPLPNARPSMRQVIQYLDGDMPLPNLSSTSLNFTMLGRMYGTDFNQNMMSSMSSASSGAVSDFSPGR